MSDFSYEKKVRLRNKIEKHTKSQNDILYVKKILKQHNPSICIVKNNNGSFIDILNLKPSTYTELAKYIENMETQNNENDNNKNINDNNKTEIIQNDTQISSCEYGDNKSDNVTLKRLKYTNSENHILNRVKYEKSIKKHQNNEDDTQIIANKNDI
jgi:endo-alpha-1,4-polygalactosaminidase (GH114 family)